MAPGEVRQNLMKIGITGHQRLRQSSNWAWVSVEMRKILSSHSPSFTGVTSLAAGADQLFAEIVLENGGYLEIIIPFEGYENTFAQREERERYLSLLAAAFTVEVLDNTRSKEEAYLMAGERVVDRSDLVLAVWDGQPSAGLGGTADVVRYALDCQKNLIHLNPVTREVLMSR